MKDQCTHTNYTIVWMSIEILTNLSEYIQV